MLCHNDGWDSRKILLPIFEQQRVLVDQLYARDQTVTQKLETTTSMVDDFSNKIKVYTQSDTFELPTRVILSDDGEYREIFRGDGAAVGLAARERCLRCMGAVLSSIGDTAPVRNSNGAS